MIERIFNSLKKRLNARNLGQIAQSSYICEKARIIGKEYFFIPISFKNKLLTIEVKDNYVAQEIQFKKEEIIKKINLQIKSNMVDNIRVKVN